MPEIPDVVAGQFVESSWGNDIRDRTVQRYADATERDALNPLPVAGDLAYLQGPGLVTVYDGSTWQTVQYVPDPLIGTVVRTGNPADSTTLSAAANTPQVLGSIAIPFGGIWRISQSGFIEGSTNANSTWTLRSRTTGGTVISEAQERNPGSSVAGWGTTARNNLAASVVFGFSGPNTLNLEALRTETGGTVLMRRWQLVGEYLGPS